MANAELWQRARRARAKIEAQLSARPEVRLIDIGAAPDGTPVVQVHVDGEIALAQLLPQASVDGIAVEIRRAAPFRPE
jgi:hypothetical protein